MPRNPNKLDYSGGLPTGFEKFIVIEDPRTGGNKRHCFGEIIFIAVSSLVCGVKSFSGMIEFAHLHKDWLKKWIDLPNGIPVVQTLINLFSLMDSKIFGQCVVEHIKLLYPDLASQLIAVDGKTIRGSAASGSQQEHCLSAWAADAGVTLALEFIQEKSNEIPAIPKLLDQLEIKGHVISVDAMGTQTAVAKKVIDKGADYLMALKRNQSALHDEVIAQFHFATTQIALDKSKAWSLAEETEKANGRVTTRRVAVTDQLDWMQNKIRDKWSNLKSLIMIETTCYDVSTKLTTIHKRYYISSLEVEATEFKKLIRQHWSIENGCHWVLDTLYREDHSQVRIRNAVRNLAIIRRMAHNLLKIDTSIKKSLPMKQMRAMVNDSYRNHVLSLLQTSP